MKMVFGFILAWILVGLLQSILFYIAIFGRVKYISLKTFILGAITGPMSYVYLATKDMKGKL